MIALAESPRTPDVLWAGTDDGNLWVTKDGGANWTNVAANLASAGVPGPRCIGTIEPSRDKDGRCYVVLDAHRSDDDRPYVCVSDDFGNSWKSLNNNLPSFGSTRCLREDTVNTNILYLGTEFGAWISANKGASWSRLGSGLPTVAVHEFAQPTTANEIVAATHGRSIWVLDVNAIRQMKPETLKEKIALFAPAPAVRWKLGVGGESPYSVTDRKFVGTNPTRGAVIEYCLAEKAASVSLKIVDVTGRTVWTAPTGRQGAGGPGGPGGRFGGGGGPGGPGGAAEAPPSRPLTDPGLHRVVWTMGGGGGGRGGGGGARQQVAGVQPGMYRVVLTVGDKEYTQPLTVEIDPNAPRDVITIGGDGDEVTTDGEEKGAGRIDD
jgi:hypothetical protein